MPHFTKGEWEVIKHNDDSGYTIKSIGRIVAKIPFTVPNENSTHEADARLIAAAPDLVAEWDCVLGYLYESYNLATNIPYKRAVREHICYIEKLLARIRGEHN